MCVNVPAGATFKVGRWRVPSEQWDAPIVASTGTVDVVVVDSHGKEIARQTVITSAGQKTPVSLDANAARPAPAGARAVETNPAAKPGVAPKPTPVPDGAGSST